jgi:hypothetical protein
MTNRFGVFAPGALAAIVVLAGCAGSVVQTQPLAPQSRAGTHGLSWMAPNAGGKKNLLYVSYGSSVLVYDYGTTTEVGQLSYFSHAAGSCTDPSGDVYVTNYGAADVIEFAHGGSKPIQTLIDPSPYATDCAFDPSTGNLAVINKYGQSEYSPGNVAIYTKAKGKPKTYKIKGFTTYVSGSYDARGNLLVSAAPASSYVVEFAMLQHRSNAFKAATLQRSGNFKYPGYVRWDGEYFDVEWEYFGVSLFEWYTIKDYNGTYEGYMLTEESGEGSGPYWLGRIGGAKSVTRANQLVGAMTIYGVMGWNYPRGGSYIFQIYDDSQAGGVSASAIR